MWEPRTPSERALVLAAISGLKVTYGPTLLAASTRRPWAGPLALAALGELVMDKLGFLPPRSRLPLLVPRALAGAWVARESLRAEGMDEPWAAPMGAAAAAAVAVVAPTARAVVGKALGVPDPFVGLAEDYCALQLGTRALDMPMNQLTGVVGEAVEDLRR